MRWHILRHGDREPGDYYNPTLRHQDGPISAAGRAQAQRLVQYFAGQPLAAIYISQYLRTMQTAWPVAQATGLTPVVDGRLNEIHNGLLEGLSDGEVQSQYPEVWDALEARDRDFRFPDGESGEEARARLASFVDEKVEHDRDILVVCHEGLIRLWMCYLLGLPVYRRWDFRADTCGITEIEYQPAYRSWKLLRFNHTLPGGP